jgi:hypothetical protein
MGALSSHPCLPVLKTSDAARPLRSTDVTRFLATTGLAAAVSPSVGFPGAPVMRLTCSIDASMGRGRFLQLLDMSLSPCCPSPPRRSDRPPRQLATWHAAFAQPSRARPPESFSYRGHHWVHLRCGPATRSPSQGWLGWSASSDSFPPRMRPKLRRFLTFPPVGLTPTQHVCLSWTH